MGSLIRAIPTLLAGVVVVVVFSAAGSLVELLAGLL